MSNFSIFKKLFDTIAMLAYFFASNFFKEQMLHAFFVPIKLNFY